VRTILFFYLNLLRHILSYIHLSVSSYLMIHNDSLSFSISESPPPPYCLIADRLRPEGECFVFHIVIRNICQRMCATHLYICVRVVFTHPHQMITHVYCLQTFIVQAASIFPNVCVVSHDLAQNKVENNPGMAAFPSFGISRQLIYKRSRLREQYATR